MKNKLVIASQEVHDKFQSYPESVKEKMLNLRELVLQVVEALPHIATVEETLKWGEPSYLAKKGSTLRMDWKEKIPNQYALYFKCTSLLVPTFKRVFGDMFQYEGNRAIVFQLNDVIPELELKQCIAAALTYHSVKHLPNLGL